MKEVSFETMAAAKGGFNKGLICGVVSVFAILEPSPVGELIALSCWTAAAQ